MTRVGTLHCWKCGASVPVGAEVLAPDYGRLVSQARVICLECNLKAAELPSDSQRLAALVEGLRTLGIEYLISGTIHNGDEITKRIDALLLAHGFATEPQSVQEGPQEAAGAVASPEAGKGA